MTSEPDLRRHLAERNADLAAATTLIETLRDERTDLTRRVARLERELWAARHTTPVVPVVRGFPVRALRCGDGIPR
jgi:hypothetical protein